MQTDRHKMHIMHTYTFRFVTDRQTDRRSSLGAGGGQPLALLWCWRGRTVSQSVVVVSVASWRRSIYGTRCTPSKSFWDYYTAHTEETDFKQLFSWNMKLHFHETSNSRKWNSLKGLQLFETSCELRFTLHKTTWNQFVRYACRL